MRNWYLFLFRVAEYANPATFALLFVGCYGCADNDELFSFFAKLGNAHANADLPNIEEVRPLWHKGELVTNNQRVDARISIMHIVRVFSFGESTFVRT